MRIFNQPTAQRTEKSIINWEDENVEVCHAPDEDPKELVNMGFKDEWIQSDMHSAWAHFDVRDNQEQFHQEYLGQWQQEWPENRFMVTSSSPQVYYEPYQSRRVEPVPMEGTIESIGEHIKHQASQYISQYIDDTRKGYYIKHNDFRDEEFVRALKDKLLKDAKVITPIGINIEDLRVEKVIDHRTMQPTAHFQLIFNNDFDRQRVHFELNMGDYY